MSAHTFKVGDVVSYSSSIGQRDDGAYEITRVLPSDGPEPSYRLRNIAEPRERVAQQHELRPLRGNVVAESETPRRRKAEPRPHPEGRGR
jgi:hypothetical protein